jgi:YfiH family protein
MNLDYIIPTWPTPEDIKCVTTKRIGGYSQHVYRSLNLGDHVKDDKENVDQNRQLIKKDLQLPNDPVWLEQVHGSRVLHLAKDIPKHKTADAAYTSEVGVVCAVLTADCLPVVFCDQVGDHVAVAHAGWRGLIKGVLKNTLQTIPVANENIMCWLGPAIGSNKFEVGEEVVEQFLANNVTHENAFQKQSNEKYLANIYQLAINILSKYGVINIYGGEYCTYGESDKFYSYRRDGVTGRMATLVWKT